ncbi:MAG: long-chain fatty acid--CoA ligase, partial [Rhodospirillaceae bacterium]|nr:long-chain fatty acid--CoA ligase [Rhodospirillaceae bacterium]
AFQGRPYGRPEAAGTVSTSRRDDSYEARIARLGAPLEGLEVRIVDPDGREAPPGAHGEIAIRGYGIIDGYYKDPEKTAEALRDGWLHTGDIGSVDEGGHVMFHGRTKDMLKVGGENVAALEIEALVGSHPEVRLCQVVGCPDDRLVEVPAAFVELKTPGAVGE